MDVLPPLFEMDDYNSCLGNNGNYFCSVQGILDFSFQNSSIREFIKNLTTNKSTFDRSIIHRGLCIPKGGEYHDQNTIRSYSSSIINGRIRRDFNLTATVDDVTCIDNIKEVTSFDKVILNLELRHFKNSTTYLISYQSTISIWSSSFIGVIMGNLYYNKKHTVYSKTWKLNILWSLSCFGLTGISLLLCHTEVTDRLVAAVLGSLVKPMYTLGVGLGIWAMSYNFGGIMKRILENKNIVLLSNFTFCVYLLHTGVINVLHSSTYEPIVFNELVMIKDYFFTVIISFVLGIIVTLAIEEPGLILQKKYLPQVSKWVHQIKERNQ
ncbi:unnamed protein product [Psylliodes chrysocephalus]|uniref:Acyltransferase 3 domain-containing protein n=1 Tax=Psylliodes chrysocephalus TaxID=3402493 RepID=A0A9P0D240_9CUCU|nr:unnamed protein product [Psylliodes chrysocephala]